MTSTLVYFLVSLIVALFGYMKHKDFDRFLFYLVFVIIIRMIYDSY